jgi:hypothetical protein
MWLDLAASIARAEERLGAAGWRRRARRSDAGEPRLSPAVARALRRALLAHERPSVTALRRSLGRNRLPARSTIYAFMDRVRRPAYPVAGLPPAARAALYNVDAAASVPGHQLVFYCLNYGDLAAISFAASLPWLALHQARRIPGWRPKSRGLLEAIALVRDI